MNENLPYPKMWEMLKDHLEEIMNFFIRYNKNEKVWKYILEALDNVVHEPTWDKHNALGFMYGVYYCLNKIVNIEEDAEIEKRDKDKDKDISLPYEDFIASVKRLMRENFEE